jgi:NADH-quinone oxidoreductase subunit A
MDEASLYWVLILYCGVVIVLVAALIAGSYFLGERHSDKATRQPFESGIVPVGYARFRLPVQFYLVAMFFVIFDLEAAFIFAWASAIRLAGWNGYLTILVFIGTLLAALVYLWRVGALDWGPQTRRLPIARLR